MKLSIISPEKVLYIGSAEMVRLPGLQGAFTILERHAPIISGLEKGKQYCQPNPRFYVGKQKIHVIRHKPLLYYF
jgi:F0F1-type ATP synthase epsilon subunit